MEPQDAREILINGKRVVFKERLPLSKAPELPAMLAKVESDLRAVARVGAVLIEDWEFDGNPSDRRSYEDLDIPTEVMPLAKALGEYISRRMDWSGAKN